MYELCVPELCGKYPVIKQLNFGKFVLLVENIHRYVYKSFGIVDVVETTTYKRHSL